MLTENRFLNICVFFFQRFHVKNNALFVTILKTFRTKSDFFMRFCIQINVFSLKTMICFLHIFNIAFKPYGYK